MKNTCCFEIEVALLNILLTHLPLLMIHRDSFGL